jgi:uncharacterized delta-60 repeat protein
MFRSLQKMTIVMFAVMLTTVVSTPTAYSAPGGELDASFGENGRLVLGPGIFEFGYGRAIAQQSNNGKLLIAGYVDNQIAVLRLETDGSLDDAFGENGIAIVDFGQAGEVVFGLALQPDGRIVVAGSVYLDLTSGVPEADFALARLDADGAIDATFGGDGFVTLDLGGSYEYIFGITLLPNGQIVAAGTTETNGNTDYAFARFDANGALDVTFGTGSVAGTTIIDASSQHPYADNDEPYWITVQADGKLVACGVSDTDYWDYPGQMTAVRLNADGSLDTAFGINGVVQFEQISDASSCVAMPNGTIVLAGATYRDGSNDLMIARLTPDGLADPTFGDAGIRTIDLGGFDSVHAMSLLSDGNLGVAGRLSSIRENISGSPADMFIAHIDPDSGLPDPDFGNQGVTIVDFGFAGQTAYSEGVGIVQQADGKLVAVGTTNDGESPVVAVARVDTDGGGNAGFAGWTFTADRVLESTGDVVVSVRRTGGSTGELSVDYDTIAGTARAPDDFTSTFGTLTWLNGDLDPKIITVPITSDSTSEADEHFTIVLTNPTSALAASEFLVTISETTAPVSPGGPGGNGAVGSGDSGGGGSVGIGLLLLMATTAASRRRRIICPVRRSGTSP